MNKKELISSTFLTVIAGIVVFWLTEGIQPEVSDKNGKDAVNLRIAEQYLEQFGKLAKENNSMIIPTDLADISSILAAATSVIKETKK